MTSPAPANWDYEVIGMITAQTTSGTGFLTELSRDFNDFFGTSSNTSSRKVEAATRICKADLRVQCVRLGGNAIISTDIDFSEIGSGSSNMLMVCMAGTAIKVKELANINEDRKNSILEVIELTQKLEAITKVRV
ncbi:heavy metal-binding domain-containing protein [Telluribacter humicola]|uniref:heavy metal-binding domain-containing protein n=1 Tax=Telluribacter humicola TaxID=1720261 RepID=UPI001A97561F|nr:heavy metal-binding domain-containing protein [Telluribacter humicola]